ncbi:ribonuclease P protein component [Anaeromyxobacter sp. Fw109-5]|nr:ribonuclease P protein component [Anaeromyxobacter sp. Fw109-5]
MPRHEADISAEEAAPEPHARLQEAHEHAGRAERDQEPSREGPQAPHAQHAEEVVLQVKLPKAARLRRRREFLLVQQRGTRLYAGDVLVLALDSRGTRPRIGITVSSKIANAVERNRVKRWVREEFRAMQGDLPAVNLVVIARAGVLAAGRAEVRRALEAARARLERGERA